MQPAAAGQSEARGAEGALLKVIRHTARGAFDRIERAGPAGGLGRQRR